MPARWRVAKLRKMANERRQAPRSLGVNWMNGVAVKTGSIDLELEGRVAEEMETRKPRAPNLHELGVTFNGLKFITIIPQNTFQKLQFFYTPKKDVWYVVWYSYQLRKVHVSLSYSSRERAQYAWDRQKVRWKYIRKLA